MKSSLIFVCIMATVIGTTVKNRNKKKLKAQSPKNYYINNWSEYKMPQEIETEKLKKIMENIALFKRQEYCPYGKMKRCHKASVTNIVQQVIQNVMDYKHHADIPDSEEYVADDSKLADKTKPSDPSKTDHTTTVPNDQAQVTPNPNKDSNLPSNSKNENTAAANSDSANLSGSDAPANDGSANQNDAGDAPTSDDSANLNGANDAAASDGSANGGSDGAAGDDAANPNGEGDTATNAAADEAADAPTDAPADEAADKPTDAAADAPADAEAGGDSQLRALKKLIRPNRYSTKGSVRNDLKDNMVNVVKMVNLGNNVQYFLDNKGKNNKKEGNNEDEKHVIQMLQLFERIINVKNRKQHLILPKIY